MSCCKDTSENCVCDVLREIARVQSDITGSDCTTSCDKSISDLLGETNNRSGLDTVPLILYCRDSCKPFKAYGARSRGSIGVIEASFYFRVQKVKDNCCAVIELLRDPTDVSSSKVPNNPTDPAHQKTRNLRGTGICITVDLKCFCHVTCLPAINARD